MWHSLQSLGTLDIDLLNTMTRATGRKSVSMPPKKKFKIPSNGGRDKLTEGYLFQCQVFLADTKHTQPPVSQGMDRLLLGLQSASEDIAVASGS